MSVSLFDNQNIGINLPSVYQQNYTFTPPQKPTRPARPQEYTFEIIERFHIKNEFGLQNFKDEIEPNKLLNILNKYKDNENISFSFEIDEDYQYDNSYVIDVIIEINEKKQNPNYYTQMKIYNDELAKYKQKYTEWFDCERGQVQIIINKSELALKTLQDNLDKITSEYQKVMHES